VLAGEFVYCNGRRLRGLHGAEDGFYVVRLLCEYLALPASSGREGVVRLVRGTPGVCRHATEPECWDDSKWFDLSAASALHPFVRVAKLAILLEVGENFVE
jgi:hypothetical protein